MCVIFLKIQDCSSGSLAPGANITMATPNRNYDFPKEVTIIY